MCKRQSILYPILLCIFCFLLLLGLPATGVSQDKVLTSENFIISDVKTSLQGNNLSMQLMGNTEPAYTVSERFSPFRVVVDIANASFAKGVIGDGSSIPANDFVTLNVSEVALDSTKISRFEFTLADSHTYTVKRNGSILNLTFTTNTENQKTTLVKFTDIKISSTPTSTTILLEANNLISEYTVETLGANENLPPRMYIDVNNANFSELIDSKEVGTGSLDKIRISSRDNGGRIVFNSATNNLFDYSVIPVETGLKIVINETTSINSKNNSDNSPADETLKQLLKSSEELATSPENNQFNQEKNTKQSSVDKINAAFLGYKKDRISVDFYKIDLHNVFRLFREVSGLNILVDEGVSGNITIAMNDVPWDFALDVILNLKELSKEERHNTIVIYPNDKGFSWPSDSAASGNLIVEADPEIINQEELIIEQSANQSKEIILAKEILAKAKTLEAKGDFTKAAEAYANANELWPENAKIVDRLTTIYLVNLKMNARALHFAKRSLDLDQNNTEAALYAAISSANMGRTAEAAEYFRQSISSTPPAREALASFAAFSENNGNNDSALKLLKKLHEHYGESIESMVAVARILDKQGEYELANKQYSAILTSGFQMRPALRSYIVDRIDAQ